MEHPLLKEIEKCREKLITQYKMNGFSSEELIEASQELDRLLNKYNALKNEDKQSN